EGDHRQLTTEGVMESYGIVRTREGEQRVGAAGLRLLRHLEARGARHDGAHRQRRAPRGEHEVPLLRGEVRPAPRVRRYGDPRDLVLRHPARIGAQGIPGPLVTANGGGGGGNETPSEAMSRLGGGGGQGAAASPCA